MKHPKPRMKHPKARTKHPNIPTRKTLDGRAPPGRGPCAAAESLLGRDVGTFLPSLGMFHPRLPSNHGIGLPIGQAYRAITDRAHSTSERTIPSQATDTGSGPRKNGVLLRGAACAFEKGDSKITHTSGHYIMVAEQLR